MTNNKTVRAQVRSLITGEYVWMNVIQKEPMTAPDVNADVRARFERRYSEDDVRACAKRMKFYDHQIAAAILTEYADKLAAHADLAGEVRELVADALRRAAKVIELYDDAAANACEMATSTDCAEILNALADQAAIAKFHPTQQEKP